MRTTLSKILGILFILAAAAGLVFSVFGLVRTWQLKASFTEGALRNLDLLDTTLNTTLAALDIVDTALVSATSNLAGLQLTTDTLAETVRNTQPMVGSVTKLLGEDLPATITATQTSLASAQTSAQLIDNFLSTISNIPFLGLGRYQPEIPLNVALRDVSSSLSPIPTSLAALERDLTSVGGNLSTMQGSIEDMGANIAMINTSLLQAHGILDDYRTTVTTFTQQVEAARLSVPAALNQLAWWLTVLFGWLIVAQVALFVQGLGLVQS